eukprot:TRINITY_DN76995_c0_g1_i1.p3 TRINITY_DN76995_c0_g1~~TRINITY_DN76995_c0_g1_i1.p3  ORF type:complete len:117 (-),score=14.58 TRINITY_DN76995_c0_g1_i1:29-379(-)
MLRWHPSSTSSSEILFGFVALKLARCVLDCAVCLHPTGNRNVGVSWWASSSALGRHWSTVLAALRRPTDIFVKRWFCCCCHHAMVFFLACVASGRCGQNIIKDHTKEIIDMVHVAT